MSDRIAVITGASSGIGRATALRLAEKQVRMVLHGRDEKKLCGVLEEVNRIAGEKISCIVCGDISNKQVTGECLAKCIDAWGRPPDIFISCSGRGLPGTVTSSNEEEWDHLIDTNFKGLLHQLKGIGTVMLEHSVNRDFVRQPLDIVVIGSNIGRNVSPFNSVYGATKFAAHGVTEALRRQLGPHGIRVTLVEPGLVNTGFQRAAGYDMEWFEKYAKEVGPVLEAEDIAGVIDFLLALPGNVHMDNVSIRPTRQAYP